MTSMIRLFEKASGRSLIVDAANGRAYQDRDGDGKVSASEELKGPGAAAAVKAAQQIDRLFVAAIPGTVSPEGDFEVRGPVGPAEADAFHAGLPLPVERSALKQHLDFFDQDRDGKMTLGESYRGFRDVGFSPVKAGVKAFMAGMIFAGPMKQGKVDIEGIANGKRYASSTGIYDAQGRLDEGKLGEYLAEFAKAGGKLPFDDVLKLLAKKAQAGTVSKNQFKSLFTVCEKMNRGEKVVTADQFRGLFDGSLLWRAASLTGADGHRALSNVHKDAVAGDDRAKLGSWLDGVKSIPRPLRTKEAAALYGKLSDAGVSSSLDLAATDDLAALAKKAGLDQGNVAATLKKCPFGF